MWARIALSTIVLMLAPSSVSTQGLEAAVPPDMGCNEGKRSKEWLSVKKRFRALFDESKGPFKPVPTEEIVASVKAAMADVEAVGGLSRETDAVAECGFGKLFIQLLSIVTVDEPAGVAQYFQEHPSMASPVLTMLLDIPWIAMAQSGWPFFAILAQINYQKTKLLAPMLNVDAVDGLANEASRAYFDLMQEGQKNGDMVSMATASTMYLRGAPIESPYGTLTAMATQSAISMNVQDRLKSLESLQDAFRQTTTTPSELDIALTIRWPLWGFLHAAVDVFADI